MLLRLFFPLALLMMTSVAFAQKSTPHAKSPPAPSAAPATPSAPEAPEPPVESEASTQIPMRDRSQNFYQTPGGKLDLIPNSGISSYRQTYKTSDLEASQGLIFLGGTAAYGISDMFAVSASVGVGGGTTSYENCGLNCNSTRHRGMTDPILEADFRLPIGTGALRVGLDYRFSLADHEIESDGDSNLATGGSEFDLEVGFEMGVARHWFGGGVEYDLMRGDSTVDDRQNSTKYKIEAKPALTVHGFYEYHLPKVAFGGGLSYTQSPETKDNTAGVKTGNGDKYTSLGIFTYVPIYVTPTITLIPALYAESIDFKQDTTIKNASRAAMSFEARFTF